MRLDNAILLILILIIIFATGFFTVLNMSDFSLFEDMDNNDSSDISQDIISDDNVGDSSAINVNSKSQQSSEALHSSSSSSQSESDSSSVNDGAGQAPGTEDNGDFN